MREVKYYHVTLGGLVEGESLGRTTVVLVADFDAEHDLRLAAERAVDDLNAHLTAYQTMLPQAEMDCETLRTQRDTAMELLRELEGDHTLMLQMGASEFGPTECRTLRARLVKLRAFLNTTSTEGKDHESN